MDHGRLARIALVAGLSAAAIEMVPILPIQAALGNSPVVVFQSIAAGAMGKAAFAGGMPAALLGAFFHTLISVVTAWGYALAAARSRWLADHVLLGGIGCGLVAYIVMTFVVVPLSAIGFRFPPTFGLFLLSFSIHIVAFGLPIAWIVSRMLATNLNLTKKLTKLRA